MLCLSGFDLFVGCPCFRDTLPSILVFVNENCCLCTRFTELYLFYWLLVVSLAILIAALNQPQWRTLHFSRGQEIKCSCVRGQIMPTRENQYACHDLSVWNIFNKRPKFTFAQSKRFSPKHNLLDRENNSLEQAACFHEVKVVCFLPSQAR